MQIHFSLYKHGLIVLLASLLACGTDTQQESPPDQESPILDTTASSPKGLVEDLDGNLSSSRGLEGIARVTGFKFEERFPLLYEMLKENTDDLTIVNAYARKVLMREGINNEEDIINLLDVRQEQIIPLLGPYLEQIDGEKWYQSFESIEAELNQLGLMQITAEGMYAGLGKADIFTDLLRTEASNGLRQFVSFGSYESLSRGGEYPYANMEPYFEMLRIGEKLMTDKKARIFYQKVKEEFQRALRATTDIHILEENGQKSILVGGIHTDLYPFMSETESHAKFVKEYPNSRFAPVVQRILANTSTISAKPETIYLIVTEWAESLNEAEDKVFEYLNAQKDVPHYLQVRRGNGSDQYAITYRFFEDETKANTALKKCRDSGIQADLLFVSVKGEQLYQIGI